MSDTEPFESLWAPWRVEYYAIPRPLPDFLLEAASSSDDAAHLVLARGKSAFLILNRFPYSPGHVMAVPYRKVGDWDALSEAEVLDLWRLSAVAQRALRAELKAQGFNIGLNLGICAGAGAPDHLHLHIVPRWEHDTNFMPVLGGVRIQGEALDGLYARLRSAVERIGTASV